MRGWAPLRLLLTWHLKEDWLAWCIKYLTLRKRQVGVPLDPETAVLVRPAPVSVALAPGSTVVEAPASKEVVDAGAPSSVEEVPPAYVKGKPLPSEEEGFSLPEFGTEVCPLLTPVAEGMVVPDASNSTIFELVASKFV
jgi:hypothetical protein